MRIRRLAVPIAILSVLTVLGGVTAGLIWARVHVSHTPPLEVMVSPAETPLKVDTPSNPQQQVDHYAGRSGREVSGQRRADTGEDNPRILRDSLEPPSAVEENAENTAGNGAVVNGTNDGIIEKRPQHGQNAGPVPRSEPSGRPVALPGASGGGDDQAPALPEKTELKYPNLGSRLNDLVVQVEEGEASAREAAEDAPVHQEASVAVTIRLTGNVDEVVSFLEDNGGDPRNVGEEYIEAYVPVTLLGRVSEQAGVIRVREIIPPEPAG